MSASSASRADGILLGVTFLAGLGWIFSREAVQSWPPMLFIGCRFALASLVLIPFGLRYYRFTGWGDIRKALLTGAIMGFAMLFWVLGVSHATQLGVGAFLACLGTLLVPAAAWVMFRESSPFSIWLALAVALVGVVFLAWDKGFSIEIAHIWFLCSAVLFAVLFNLNTRYAASLPIMQLVAIQLAVVGAINIGVSAMLEPWPETTTAGMWGWFLASVFIATSLRFLLQVYAQGQVPAARAALIMMMEPVWTTVMAMIWYGEMLSANQWLGCGLILFALLMNRWRQIRKVFSKRDVAPGA
ncbi:DMT family transporter [Pokkaliibacter sp. CJK22405]|uniref:DMT family transporter n=1 Tax=Pokkaliibacter sp. CJK22405 TaxID=3384615 RepID=UPI0039846CD1